MSESDPSRISRFNELQQTVEQLFNANPDMVTQYAESPDRYNDRLSLVVSTEPKNIEGEDIPASLYPYVIDRTAAGFRLREDAEANISAAPTTDERRGIEAWRRKGEKSVHLHIFDDPHAINQFSREDVAYYEDRKIRATRLEPDDTELEGWLEIVRSAVLYNRDSHGILRHEKHPDGRRMGSDRLATHEEIARYKRELEIRHMGRWRRMAITALRHIGLSD